MKDIAERFTLKDIARLAKVDVSTVSRALHDSPLVRDSVKEKIRKLAREHHYTPNASAYSLRKRLNRSVALVFPWMNFLGGDFYSTVMSGLGETFGEKHFTCVISDLRGEMNSFMRIAREGRVDAALLLGDVWTQEELMAVSELGIDIVVVNMRLDKLPNHIYNVHHDNMAGIRLMVDHLVATGRRKLVHLTGGDRFQSARERREAFIQCCRAAGVSYDVWEADFERGFTLGNDLIVAAAKRGDFKFDGVVCASDELALGVIRGLTAQGIKAGVDVGVTGYDNVAFGNYFPVPITTVDPGAREMGKMAARILLDLIIDKKDPLATRLSTTPQVVLRSSTGAA